MAEQYVKSVKEHFDAPERLRQGATSCTAGPRSIQHDTHHFGRQLHLLCNLLFGAPPEKEQPMTDHVGDLVEWLHDIHHYACQHLHNLILAAQKCLPTNFMLFPIKLLNPTQEHFNLFFKLLYMLT
jgi:hypothetical protein